MSTGHVWRFFRAGGFDQVRLDRGTDLAALAHLDQKLWVALSCPTRGIEFDTRTLDLIDTDKDGRIRAPDIIAATAWACGALKNPDALLRGSPDLELDAIQDATPEGRQLRASAERILANLGKPGAAAITPDDTSDTARIFAQTQFNGDGIVPAEAAPDAPLQALIGDIISCLGGETDRSGKPGVNQAKVDLFFTEAQAFVDWQRRPEADPALLPFGDATPAAVTTIKAVKSKVDDFFARCRLAAFDPRAIPALNREEKEYLVITTRELTASAAEVAALPLARVEPGAALPLQDTVNPAWAAVLARLQADVVRPLLGERKALTEAEWTGICARIAPYEAWTAAKCGGQVEKLGVARVRVILAGAGREAVTALIAKDQALAAEANGMTAVHKLVLFHRDLYRLLNNFVCFRDFYSRKIKAVFQVGTLYLDQRSCDLCVRVEDVPKHAALAGLAKTYLAYCDCVRTATGERMTIAAAFTGGDSDNLMLGRNGIFYDRKGRDWDATITRIVDNPISIRQAFWAPYKKFLRMIEEQVAKRAAAADATATTNLQNAATATVNVDPMAPRPAAPPPPPKKVDPGMLAAIGLVLTTLLAALGGIFGAFAKLPVWQIPLALAAIMLAISLPSMVIAWLKLRQRNLGPILDANGWAVNARAKINVPFGGSLTAVAVLPPGSHRDLVDPFAEKKSPWPALIILGLLVAATVYVLNVQGFIYKWTRGTIGREVPAAQTVAPPAAPTAPAAPAKAPAAEK